MKVFDILKKHCGSLHKNKFVKGDKVIWHDATFVVCDVMKQRGTTKYIIIDDIIGKYLFEWIDETELKKFGKFKNFTYLCSRNKKRQKWIL